MKKNDSNDREQTEETNEELMADKTAETEAAEPNNDVAQEDAEADDNYIEVPHIDPPLSSEHEIEETNSSSSKKKEIGLIIAIIALAFVVTGLICALILQSQSNTNSSQQSPKTEATEQTSENHVHDWETNMVTVEAPRLIENIEHPAVYENKEIEHTICNTCNKIIDGKTSEHFQETGHQSYSTKVPITEQVLIQNAWIEERVVQEYASKTVENGEKCRTCSETRGEKSLDELRKSLDIKTSL